MRARSGVGLVEVIVALVLVAVGALASAAALGVSARVHARSASLRAAVAAARAAAETLRVTPCDALARSAGVTDGISLEWDVDRGERRAVAIIRANWRESSVVLSLELACE